MLLCACHENKKGSMGACIDWINDWILLELMLGSAIFIRKIYKCSCS